MAELQEHGYPDWQRLSQQQGERLYANNSVTVKKGSPVTLGPFYVGLTPAVTLYAIGRLGIALTRVNIIWGASKTMENPRITEQFILAEEESLLHQQLTCQGQWMGIEFNALVVTEEPTYEVILQPNALVYSEPRLGDGFLLSETFAISAGKTLIRNVHRVAPGRATLRVRISSAKVTTFLTAERFTGTEWKKFWMWALNGLSAERAQWGLFAEPLNLPSGPVRFKLENFGAEEQAGEIYLSYP